MLGTGRKRKESGKETERLVEWEKSVGSGRIHFGTASKCRQTFSSFFLPLNLLASAFYAFSACCSFSVAWKNPGNVHLMCRHNDSQLKTFARREGRKPCSKRAAFRIFARSNFFPLFPGLAIAFSTDSSLFSKWINSQRWEKLARRCRQWRTWNRFFTASNRCRSLQKVLFSFQAD